MHALTSPDSKQPRPPLLRLLEESDPGLLRTGKLFIGLSAAVVLGFILWRHLLGALGLLDGYMDSTRLALLQMCELGILLGWGVLYGLMRICEKRRREPPGVLIHAVVQYFSLTFALLGYAIGNMSMAGGVFIVGAPMLGFLLIGRTYVLWGLATSLASMAFISWGAAAGWFPYAPMLGLDPRPEHTVSPVWAASQWVHSIPFGLAALYVSATLLARWKERERHIMYLSISDTLTQTFNRTYGMERLREEMARCRRLGSSVSIVMVDLDHFKNINDQHGHLTGDDALRRAARALRQEVRTSDVVCRYGGEEFLLILPDTDLEGSEEVAERCRAAVERQQLQSAGGVPVPLTASLGIASYAPGKDADSEDELLRAADEALYAAKSGGRNRVVRAS